MHGNNYEYLNGIKHHHKESMCIISGEIVISNLYLVRNAEGQYYREEINKLSHTFELCVCVMVKELLLQLLFWQPCSEAIVWHHNRKLVHDNG